MITEKLKNKLEINLNNNSKKVKTKKYNSMEKL